MDIDYQSTESVPLDYGIDESYRALHPEQRSKVKQYLYDHYEDGSVDRFLDLSDRWKESSYTDHAQTLERIFSFALDIEGDERNGELNGRDPLGDEAEIAETIQLVSERFIECHFGGKISVYRGIGHELSQAAILMLENFDQENYSLTVNILINYTTEESIADYHGEMVIKHEVRPNDIAMAVDQILPSMDENGINSPEGEVRIRGDRIRSLSSDQLVDPNTGVSLKQLFINPTEISPEEHDTVAGIVESINKDEERKLRKESSKNRIRRWFREYVKVDIEASQKIEPHVNSIIEA